MLSLFVHLQGFRIGGAVADGFRIGAALLGFRIG